MTNKKLGLHLAPGALKLVELEEQARKSTVLNYSIDYFPLESSFDSQVKTLISSIKKNKIRAKEANVVLSGADIVYKLIELPEMPEKEITSAIKYKLKATLPASFKDIEDVDVDYYKIQKLQHKGKQLFFVAAVSKGNMPDVVKIIKAAGLSLKDIVAPSCALKNALGASVAGPCALIYLGRYSSLITLIKEGQVVFARELKLGGNDITRAMVGVVQAEKGKVELDYKQAEKIKNKYGIPVDLEEYSKQSGLPGSELLAMMRPALEKLATEIQNTFEYYRSEMGDDTEFKKIYFTGGTSTTKNLLLYFGEQLGLELFPLSINISALKKDFEKDAPFLTMAVGATLTGKDHLSLMPREERLLFAAGFMSAFVNMLRRGVKIIFLGLACLLAFALVFGWFNIQQKNLENTYKVLQKEHQQRMKELGVTAEKKTQMIDLTKYMKKDRFALIMHELDSITPNDLYFQNISYNNKSNSLVIKGVMVKSDGKMSMPTFIQRLEKSKYIESIDLIYLQETEKYTLTTYDFELKCLLVGESKK